MAADRCLDGRSGPCERHVDQVEFESEPEKLAAQMGVEPMRDRQSVLAGVVPDELHQFRECLGGTCGLTTTTFGETATRVIGVKSLIGSYGTLA
jgi:hypothetical protein